MLSLVLLAGLGLVGFACVKATRLMRDGRIAAARTPIDGPVRWVQIFTGRGLPSEIEPERRLIARMMGGGVALIVAGLALVALVSAMAS